MITVGIDTLALYTSRYVLPLATLAKARGVLEDKYQSSLGQEQMSVPPPGEDIVTMAANAGYQALKNINRQDIDMLLLATESGIDQSKAAGIYVHDLLELSAHCRVVELKQACYAGTAGIQLALPYLRENPNKKVLVIATDIARYGFYSTGESSQGAGAIALVLSAHPRILAIEPEFAVLTQSVMDFWRPNYLQEALVDGKSSSRIYLNMLEKTWLQYQAASGRHFHDHHYFCYHTPVPRLVEKAHQHLLKLNHQSDFLEEQIQPGLVYSRRIGNSYTASLYIALASLLDHSPNIRDHRIGFYSYGSGCEAEYFSGKVQANYQDALQTSYHHQLLESRIPLSYEEYHQLYQFSYTEDGSDQDVPFYQTGRFRLAKLKSHKRIYEKVTTDALVNCAG